MALQLLDKEEVAVKNSRFDLRARTWMKLGLTYQLDFRFTETPGSLRNRLCALATSY